MTRLGVLGAGSWGTALAVHSASVGCSVRLWARNPEFALRLQRERRNQKYLPDVPLAEPIRVTADLAEVAAAEVILAVLPSHGFREVVSALLRLTPAGHPTTLISATKGIETESLARMSEVVSQEAESAGRPVSFAVLSGPSFAAELAVGVPTAAVIASAEEELAVRLSGILASPTLRLYSTTDVVGVELGGTTKNVIAIGAGLVTGLGLGHNTLAALITRGLHEMTRLGVAYGGQRRTFAGLAGLGDLVLTCTGGLSRNRRTGMELAKGKSLDQIRSETFMVAEGIRNTVSIAGMAEKVGIEMPITEQMMAVMYEGKAPRQAVEDLMTRELKSEAEL